MTPLSPTEVSVRTANLKDITPKLMDAQIESSCSQLKHLEKQSTALGQMKVGDNQTDIYTLLWGNNKGEARTVSYEKVYH